MTNALKLLARAFAASVLLALAHVPPAFAQRSGFDPHFLTASYTTDYTRYYAPYALQAAAAYIDVDSMNRTRGPDGVSVDGADVALAVAAYAAPAGSPDADIQERARKYLRAWRYQFGNEGYLTCFEQDPGCLRMIEGDRWKVAISGGPSFHVWARFPRKRGVACNEVSIAFRGTDATSAADWIANFRPVTGYVYDDHYRQLRRNIDAIIKKITRLDCFQRRGTHIVSVGHSLGGGLAQLAALANSPVRTRITKVFAFDPSPVTGASLLDKTLRDANTAGLEIDRIYQSGEVLTRLRRFVQQPPPSSSPCVRTVVYDVLQPAGSVTLHSMPGLAREVVRASYSPVTGRQRDYAAAPSLGCPGSRYVAPASDSDDYDAPAPGPETGPAVASLRGATAGLVRTSPDARVDRYASRDGFEFSPPAMNAVPAKLEQGMRVRASH